MQFMEPRLAKILTSNEITTGYRFSYLANYFTGPVYAQIDQETGLTRSEFVVIFCLHQLGTISAQDICLVTGRPKNSISQAVTKLVTRKLILREQDLSDARRAHLKLSASGKKMYRELMPLFENRQSSMLNVLTLKEQEQLDGLLAKLVLREDGWAD
jgi:MarR family transcriptional regulator, temperature-dependent positive regulator of motility